MMNLTQPPWLLPGIPENLSQPPELLPGLLGGLLPGLPDDFEKVRTLAGHQSSYCQKTAGLSCKAGRGDDEGVSVRARFCSALRSH